MPDSPTPTINSNESYPKSFYQDQGDNSAGFVTPWKINSGVTRGKQQLGGPNLTADANLRQLIVGKDGTPIVLMGDHPTFGEGFYVAEDGVDVVANTDPSKFRYNSNQNALKVVNIITKSFAVNDAGVVSQAYPHGQTFPPSFLCYSSSTDPNDGSKIYPATGSPSSFAHSTGYAYAVDVSNIYVAWQSDSASTYIATVKIYLLQESIVIG